MKLFLLFAAVLVVAAAACPTASAGCGCRSRGPAFPRLHAFFHRPAAVQMQYAPQPAAVAPPMIQPASFTAPATFNPVGSVHLPPFVTGGCAGGQCPAR